MKLEVVADSLQRPSGEVVLPLAQQRLRHFRWQGCSPTSSSTTTGTSTSTSGATAAAAPAAPACRTQMRCHTHTLVAFPPPGHGGTPKLDVAHGLQALRILR
jgi:hypothetical protein